MPQRDPVRPLRRGKLFWGLQSRILRPVQPMQLILKPVPATQRERTQRLPILAVRKLFFLWARRAPMRHKPPPQSPQLPTHL